MFRDDASLRAFAEDPVQALHDAGLADVTPEQVHSLLPTIAESMPADHPLQAIISSADPLAEMANLVPGNDDVLRSPALPAQWEPVIR
jgi:hypothetical protein